MKYDLFATIIASKKSDISKADLIFRLLFLNQCHSTQPTNRCLLKSLCICGFVSGWSDMRSA